MVEPKFGLYPVSYTGVLSRFSEVEKGLAFEGLRSMARCWAAGSSAIRSLTRVLRPRGKFKRDV
jgi:hypothetical protein